MGMIGFQSYIGLLFNEWYKVFYNALEQKSYDAFLDSFIQLGTFDVLQITTWGFTPLAVLSIFLFAIIQYIGQIFSFRWRESITKDYLPRWKNTLVDIEGASQRLQEDTKKFSWLVWMLGQGVVKSIMTLIFFLPILWTLSEGFDIPGYLVWVSLALSVGGLAASAFIGRKLPMLEYKNQQTEATFRKSLVHCEDNRDAVSDAVLEMQFGKLKTNYMRLYHQYKYYSLWENMYYQLAVIVPFIAVAPQYFAGAISLGVLMQVGNAFGKVHESLSYFVDNWMVVTELRSVQIRLREFEDMLPKA
jgi:peptide/bleomycin uptake transporter